MTLAPDAFHIECYFKAYVRYVKDHRLAQAEGKNPKLMEFNPPAIEEDGLDDEETTPPDGEAGSPGYDNNKAAAHEGSDHDEDPNA